LNPGRDDFIRVVENIVQSVIWQRHSTYHMARPPKNAMPFSHRPRNDHGDRLAVASVIAC